MASVYLSLCLATIYKGSFAIHNYNLVINVENMTLLIGSHFALQNLSNFACHASSCHCICIEYVIKFIGVWISHILRLWDAWTYLVHKLIKHISW